MLFSDAVFNIFAGFFFFMFSMMLAKTSLLYSIIPNPDAIIRVRMLLCENSMLLHVFVSVCC